METRQPALQLRCSLATWLLLAGLPALAAQPTAAQPTAAQPTAAQPTAAQPTATGNLANPAGQVPATGELVSQPVGGQVPVGQVPEPQPMPPGAGAGTGDEPNGDQVPQTGLQAALALESALVEAIAKAEPSVVAIARVRKTDPPLGPQPAPLVGPPDPLSPEFLPNEFATGVVIDRQGLILTNYHVLGNPEENDYYVWVQRRPFKADPPWTLEKIVAGDPWTDLAILKIAATDLVPIELGDASQLRKGSLVVTLGNPYAIARDGEVSASWGMVSNLARKAPPRRPGLGPTDAAETLHEFGTLIHTDARLNLGTSGGAMINLRGQMVGLTTSLAALAGYEKSAGFAIPVDDVFRRTVDRLKTGRKAQYGFLGVAPRNLSFNQRQAGRFGAEIVEVIPGTPAHRASLQTGDVITHVDGQEVFDRDSLFRDLSKLPLDSEVKLTVDRDGQRLVKTVTLAKKFVELAGPAIASVPEPSWRGLHLEFATAMPPDLPRPPRLIDASQCVGVVRVDKDSPAWKAGIQAGDFISHVENRRVVRPEDFLRAVEGRDGAVQVRLAGTDDSGAARQIQP
ncbi:MAG: PDZ domain-containing protein [Pirellulaceae bacterium]|nr:PDZ domain-containing protein [Pirellulaceae bacterium]